MSRHSLERSLAILAPSLTSNKKVISPVKVPDIFSDEENREVDPDEEDFDLNNLLENTR